MTVDKPRLAPAPAADTAISAFELPCLIETGEDMEALGGRLAQQITRGSLPYVVYLHGDLGAGKTTLVRGFLRALGYQDAVKSPTFTYVEPYENLTPAVYHFDLYRLKSAEDLEWLGLWEYLQAPAVCFIEWPEMGAPALPAPDLAIQIAIKDDKRYVTQG